MEIKRLDVQITGNKKTYFSVLHISPFFLFQRITYGWRENGSRDRLTNSYVPNNQHDKKCMEFLYSICTFFSGTAKWTVITLRKIKEFKWFKLSFQQEMVTITVFNLILNSLLTTKILKKILKSNFLSRCYILDPQYMNAAFWL